ncbi:AVN_collapsed_G0044780.mRNA.1.CDS.1 [Saccharomyces cerevisiae]|nr:ANM_HP_G0097170.mRNA.1.CDS.1 [Saccharomyces cerevisiae]CAI4926071.1 ANM_HP_G0109720.mRNA.1.CDS.1 [Saccharomyces cerevisiae]CAI4980040.1 ANM_HP_G0147820.mRNA.1.CDS.1 [Saccharomyces cerevisiae]CAI5033683.1 ANM_HP_G0192090.mRNA.1.CDS.1 [Saccharomyces cerevisiae]CAI5204102.1 ANM_HP_G0256250.mRNA.1.CDS.1 [Saccharomyces cerevisiae]
MNILKKFMESGNKPELITIPSGQFNLLRSKNSPKAALECIYNNATLSVRKIGKFDYELAVYRVEDDSEGGTGDEAENFEDDTISVLSTQSKKKEEEWSVEISDKIMFHKTWDKQGNVALVWENLRVDEQDEKVQFVVAADVSFSDVEQFIQTVYRCQFEVRNKKSSLTASADDLKEIEHRSTRLFVQDDDDELDSSSDDFQDAKDTSFEHEKESEILERTPSPLKKVPEGEYCCLVMSSLYMYDPIQEKFILQEPVVKVAIIDTGKYEFWLAIEGKDNRLGTQVAPNINPTFELATDAFLFNYTLQNITLSYMLKFKDLDKCIQFRFAWVKCLWMTLNKETWTDVPEKEKDYILDSSSVPLEKQFDDILHIDDRSNEERDKESSESENDSEDEDDENDHSKRIISSEAFEEPRRATSKGNSSLTVAFRNNRSYVTRDNRIGVFKTDDEDDSLEFVAAIKNISNLGGKSIDPHKPMLYMEDRNLILTDGENENKLYKMDIERGKVIEEWSTGDKNVVQYGPTKKFDQMTPEQTIVGVSQKGLFKIDPRINGKNKIAVDESKDYVGKYNFSSIGTTESGYIAIGSEKGDIKLYDRLGIRAKTAIPSLGQEIKFITTSADGKWLLATCESTLLLMDLKIKDGKNAGNIGFLKSFPASENVKTYVLKIRPEHSASILTYTKKPIRFTKAYFNTGIGQQEQTIVTSTGPYAISWSLKGILNQDGSNNYPYRIRRYNADVVADNFEFGSDKKVIVALKDDVSLSKVKSFKQPSKGVLMPSASLQDFYG